PGPASLRPATGALAARDDADMRRLRRIAPAGRNEGAGRPGRENYRSWTSVICRDCCDFVSQMRILICTALMRTRIGTDSGIKFGLMCLLKCPAFQLAR